MTGNVTNKQKSKFLPKTFNVLSCIIFLLPAFPEVQQFQITEDWEFVVLACDGIWDVMTSNEVVNFIRARLIQPKFGTGQENDTMDPEEICEELIQHCLAPDPLMGTGCDNMTVVLVCFLHGKPYSYLISRCRESSSTNP